MKNTYIPLEQTGQFSDLFIDYISCKPHLFDFYDKFPLIENFILQAEQKKQYFSAEKRQVLYQTLTQQYEGLDSPITLQLLQNENTFTITTGHQLNLFTGTLYFHYKIITVIKAAQELKKKYPHYDFVPIYWMAGEDHDFEEIASFHLFGKTYTWETSQKGATGKFIPDHNLIEIAKTVKSPLFLEAYSNAQNLADAMRKVIHQLYGKDGLIVIDADHNAFKSQMKEVFIDELTHFRSREEVWKASEKLVHLGYKPQIHPRKINLFYLDDQLRERIIAEKEDEYQVLNTDIQLNTAQIIDLVEKNPEKFSPNVVLRPLYQEILLPNIAYTGGPAEMIYWLQLKGVFDTYKVPFPILLPRNFALYLNKTTLSKMEKVGIHINELFLSEQELKNLYLQRHAQSVDFEAEESILNLFFEKVSEKAIHIDASLEGFVASEHQKTIKSLENMYKRIKKAEEQKHETALKQISSIKEKLFPNNSLQERYDNFLTFYLNDITFIQRLMDVFNPFEFQMNILQEN